MPPDNLICYLGLSLVLAACKQHADPTTYSSGKTPGSSNVAVTSMQLRTPLVGERVEIPSGMLQVGSKPGTLGRLPAFEPSLYTIDLGSFEIDRLPYPNDPARPAQVGVTREDARVLCSRSGSRLCTELEWERACKGPANNTFSTGEHFDARCIKHPPNCASGFDVLAMAVSIREWTASDYGTSNEPVAIAKGAAANAPDESHRCATRQGIRAQTSDQSLGFRCCRGAPNAARVNEPTLAKAFRKANVDLSELMNLLKQSEVTRDLAEVTQLFREPDAANTVVEKGSNDRKGLTFSVSPVLWSPSVGVQFMLVVGRSGKDTSFVLAYNVVGKDEYTLASSFIMKSETGPVALAFDDSIRTRLFFSTCWGCPGETGKVLFREPESVAILQP